MCLVVVVTAVACGKKGPPLPPLVLLPTAPAEVSAVRRGDEVELHFRIPRSNTDQSSPASLIRVDVFASTVPGPVSAEEVVRRGERVATLAVNRPRDPDLPEPATPEPKGPGVDQDEATTILDQLPPGLDTSGYRVYAVVGFNERGRRGALAPSVAVPLLPPPAPPGQPTVSYTETAITVAWAAVVATDDAPGAEAYSVFPSDSRVPLTPASVEAPSFTDAGIEWQKERCYVVRAAVMREGVRLESAPSPPGCVTPRDSFPPARPDGLVSVGSEGAISLIWTPNTEPDLAGYIVLRAVAPDTDMVPLTPEPIADTNFRDTVPAGSRVSYAVQAVDKAGNRSAPSNPTIETAR